jgi:hypothetical protein
MLVSVMGATPWVIAAGQSQSQVQKERLIQNQEGDQEGQVPQGQQQWLWALERV